jgi:hypothetical protein
LTGGASGSGAGGGGGEPDLVEERRKRHAEVTDRHRVGRRRMSDPRLNLG